MGRAWGSSILHQLPWSSDYPKTAPPSPRIFHRAKSQPEIVVEGCTKGHSEDASLNVGRKPRYSLLDGTT